MELLSQAFDTDGLWLLILAVFAAGVVRGFSGFGTAMVFVPIAAIVAEPLHVILMMMVFDVFGPLFLLPKAWRDGEPRDVGLLGIGAVIGLPVGVYFLLLIDPIVFRWIVSVLSLVLLVLLAGGWRYRNPLSGLLTAIIGVISGFMMGIAALPGPPVILSYMSSPRTAKTIRGNTLIYLFLVDVLSFAYFFIKGILLALPLAIGALLAVPYTIASIIGQRIFNPEKEHIYRNVAYAMIAFSAIAGMPIWD